MRSRGLGEAPPMWVVDFLADVGAEVHALAAASDGDEKLDAEAEKTRIGGMCLGRASMLPNRRDRDWVDLALAVEDALPHYQWQETNAYKAVQAATGLGTTVIGDAWRRYKAEFPSVLPEPAKAKKPRSGRPKKTP